jgi:ABC-type phosphate/phosphonate transport system ATPase subunit
MQVINKPCVECIIIMRLISWNHSRDSETVLLIIHTVQAAGNYFMSPLRVSYTTVQ